MHVQTGSGADVSCGLSIVADSKTNLQSGTLQGLMLEKLFRAHLFACP